MTSVLDRMRAGTKAASLFYYETPDDWKVTGWDTETFPIKTGRLDPDPVCLAIKPYEEGPFLEESRTQGDIETWLWMIDPQHDGEVFVAGNQKFDLAVMLRRCGHDPEMMTRVFDMLEAGQFQDVIIREKLLDLTDRGTLGGVQVPMQRSGYSVAHLAYIYAGQNLFEDKKSEDSWRTNYGLLADTPKEDWPQEAVDYAMNDADVMIPIYWGQEERRKLVIENTGVDPFKTLTFRCMVDFDLYLQSIRGICVDPSEKAKVEKMLLEELKPENTALLFEHGLMTKGTPSQPYANGARDHDEDCEYGGRGTKCQCPYKMKAATKDKKNNKGLLAFCEALAEQFPEIEFEWTDPSSRHPEGQKKTDAAFMDKYAHLSPVLEQWQHRQKLQKLVTTELPRMCDPETGDTAPVVHPGYDVLKETGRSSSFGGSLTASLNIQNVDPRVRNCFVPREGHLMFSIDYNQMELGTVAQTCLDLFGHSVMAELINAGGDPHAFLGARIMYESDEDFRLIADDEIGRSVDPARDLYELFLTLAEDPDTEDLYKHYRKFAKPTGLGYPGGLGAKTFIKFAKSPYGVEVDLDQAKALRETWLETYPEMREYLAHINSGCVDPRWTITDEGMRTLSGEGENLYCYDTPFGVHRAACYYCAAANGLGLQSPSAEGALLGVHNVMRSCYDASWGSPLYGKMFPLGFIHDEIIGEVIADITEARALLVEAESIMTTAMRVATPDVASRAESALMYQWDKRAEPVFDPAGQLLVWEPKREEE